MITILGTFVLVCTVMVLAHWALGRPKTELVPAFKVCGALTIAFIALSHSPQAVAALSGVLHLLLSAGPSG